MGVIAVADASLASDAPVPRVFTLLEPASLLYMYMYVTSVLLSSRFATLQLFVPVSGLFCVYGSRWSPALHGLCVMSHEALPGHIQQTFLPSCFLLYSWRQNFAVAWYSHT
jgi:hypothetical protein